MSDYRVVLTLVGSIIGILAFLPYFRDVLRSTTKPHPFTWVVWTLINLIAFFAQVAGGGGLGAGVTLVVALDCLSITVFSFVRGERSITFLDYLCFAAALIGVVLWQLTRNPFTAILFVTLADAAATIPTLRKSYLRPQEETMSSYALSAVRSFVAVFALSAINLTTALYPVFIVVADTVVVLILFIRRGRSAPGAQ
jgi:hypothetical protein